MQPSLPGSSCFFAFRPKIKRVVLHAFFCCGPPLSTESTESTASQGRAMCHSCPILIASTWEPCGRKLNICKMRTPGTWSDRLGLGELRQVALRKGFWLMIIGYYILPNILGDGYIYIYIYIRTYIFIYIYIYIGSLFQNSHSICSTMCFTFHPQIAL